MQNTRLGNCGSSKAVSVPVNSLYGVHAGLATEAKTLTVESVPESREDGGGMSRRTCCPVRGGFAKVRSSSMWIARLPSTLPSGASTLGLVLRAQDPGSHSSWVLGQFTRQERDRDDWGPRSGQPSPPSTQPRDALDMPANPVSLA